MGLTWSPEWVWGWDRLSSTCSIPRDPSGNQGQVWEGHRGFRKLEFLPPCHQEVAVVTGAPTWNRSYYLRVHPDDNQGQSFSFLALGVNPSLWGGKGSLVPSTLYLEAGYQLSVISPALRSSLGVTGCFQVVLSLQELG